MDRELLETFAREQGLTPVVIHLERFEDLVPALREGRGDVVAQGLTVLDERREKVGFTAPLRFVREQVVARVDDVASLDDPEDLVGRTLVVRRSSSYWHTLQDLVDRHPGIVVEAAPEDLETHQILEFVADGTYDLTVADSDRVEEFQAYRDGVAVAFDLTDDRPLAWAVRPDADLLRQALDTYLTDVELARQRRSVHRDDLPGIRKRRVLRVLTRNSAATYFLWRGELMGFEYDLAHDFATRHGLVVRIVVPPRHDDLLDWLAEGRGDVVAAGLTLTAARRQDPRLAWSRPYAYAVETVVARADDPRVPLAPADLAGRTVVVRRDSAYWDTLEALRVGGIDVRIEEAPGDLDTEEIIARVADGEYDLTVADSDILDIELTWRDDVRAALTLGGERPHGWAVRAENPALLEAIDAWIDVTYRGTFYNIVRDRYFSDPQRIRTRVPERTERAGHISPYDDLVKRTAPAHGFDWRLVVSQMYQESRFDPRARSPVGAVGLMQVMPRTARSLGVGVDDLTVPEDGIRAGLAYLDWTRERFEPELRVEDRLWFTLAGYNAGHGHVKDARRLARELGLDPTRWFGHTEKAMLLLSRPEHARRARYGYVRGREPVDYVRSIRERFEAYLEVTD